MTSFANFTCYTTPNIVNWKMFILKIFCVKFPWHKIFVVQIIIEPFLHVVISVCQKWRLASELAAFEAIKFTSTFGPLLELPWEIACSCCHAIDASVLTCLKSLLWAVLLVWPVLLATDRRFCQAKEIPWGQKSHLFLSVKLRGFG